MCHTLAVSQEILLLILSFVLDSLLGKTGQQQGAQFCPLLPLQGESQV